MAPNDKRPNDADPELLRRLSQLISQGEFVLFGSSDNPDGIPWGGEDCRAIVLAASCVTPGSAGTPSDPLDPQGEVFLIRYFRQYPKSTTPRKADDVLFWEDPAGYCWSLHSKDSPDHHSRIMSSTDLAGLIHDLDLPSATHGTIDEYRNAGGLLDFESPFRGE
jgi:hypothetical protein